MGLALALLCGFAGAGSCQDAATVERNMIRVVDEVSESIVSVSAVSSAPRAASEGGLSGIRPVARSVGCGVVFDADGLIVTTASVAGHARYVDVTTTAGVQYRGTVVGIDPVSDVAVVKVDAADLKPARFTDGLDVRPGSMVLILGNAFGALPSVSMGILSNVTGSLVSNNDPAMLRLAVPINPGDIGGPVVNIEGEVVGMVIGRLTFQTQTHSMQIGDRTLLGISGNIQASNMSLAIPATRVMTVADDILEKGDTRRGFLGVQVMNLSEDLRRDMGDRSINGVMVTSVVPGSPAESIGIVPGDVITSFGSEDIESVTALGNAVGTVNPGEVVDIHYLRGTSSRRDGVRIGWFVPEFVRQATFLEYPVRPDQVRSRIEILKAEMNRLEKQLEELEGR